jgi:uncharacterized protein
MLTLNRWRLNSRAPAVAVATMCALTPALGGPQPVARTLSQREMVDMMVGSSIQAGRSSNSGTMIRRVRDAVAQGKTFSMVSVDQVPDDWTVVVPSGIGGGGAWDYVSERIKQQNVPTVPNAMLLAIDALSRHIGRKFQGVLRSEAAGSTLTAFLIASELNIPVVDACMTGRAVPEMQQSIPFINGIAGTPGAMVSRWGDSIILAKVVDDYRLEDLSRAMAVASGGSIQLAANALTGSQLRRATVAGQVSQAILFGRTVREARERGQDPVAALVKVSEGFKLFQGVVSKAVVRGERGFRWWDIEIRGASAYSGHTYRVFVKNENIVSWLDGRPDVMSPDLIANLDPKTGDTVYGERLGAYPSGAEVAMVGIPASPMWRTPRGVEVLGPRHFGFDFDYVPIETLQRQRQPFRP